MHRDLKLDNLILMRKEDMASSKIIDFGLAQFIDEEEFLLQKCGSPSYIAPEVFLDEPYD